jgi:hypothetical protein
MDRAWSRRGMVAEPYFGQSLPSVAKESVVAFERPAQMTKSHGGFSAVGAPTQYLECRGHVQLDSNAPQANVIDGIIQTLQMIRAFISYPAVGDPDTLSWDGRSLPQRDDTLIWTDPLGVERRVHVRNVYDALNLGAFMQIDTELFE